MFKNRLIFLSNLAPQNFNVLWMKPDGVIMHYSDGGWTALKTEVLQDNTIIKQLLSLVQEIRKLKADTEDYKVEVTQQVQDILSSILNNTDAISEVNNLIDDIRTNISIIERHLANNPHVDIEDIDSAIDELCIPRVVYTTSRNKVKVRVGTLLVFLLSNLITQVLITSLGLDSDNNLTTQNDTDLAFVYKRVFNQAAEDVITFNEEVVEPNTWSKWNLVITTNTGEELKNIINALSITQDTLTSAENDIETLKGSVDSLTERVDGYDLMNLPNVLENIESLVPLVLDIIDTNETLTTKIDLLEGIVGHPVSSLDAATGLCLNMLQVENLAQSLSEDLYKEGGVIENLLNIEESTCVYVSPEVAKDMGMLCMDDYSPNNFTEVFGELPTVIDALVLYQSIIAGENNIVIRPGEYLLFKETLNANTYKAALFDVPDYDGVTHPAAFYTEQYFTLVDKVKVSINDFSNYLIKKVSALNKKSANIPIEYCLENVVNYSCHNILELVSHPDDGLAPFQELSHLFEYLLLKTFLVGGDVMTIDQYNKIILKPGRIFKYKNATTKKWVYYRCRDLSEIDPALYEYLNMGIIYNPRTTLVQKLGMLFEAMINPDLQNEILEPITKGSASIDEAIKYLVEDSSRIVENFDMMMPVLLNMEETIEEHTAKVDSIEENVNLLYSEEDGPIAALNLGFTQLNSLVSDLVNSIGLPSTTTVDEETGVEHIVEEGNGLCRKVETNKEAIDIVSSDVQGIQEVLRGKANVDDVAELRTDFEAAMENVQSLGEQIYGTDGEPGMLGRPVVGLVELVNDISTTINGYSTIPMEITYDDDTTETFNIMYKL